MNKVLVGIAGGVILLAFGIFIFVSNDQENNISNSRSGGQTAVSPTSNNVPAPGNNNPETSTPNEPAPVGVVVYTNDGFDPENLGPISVGDSVQFRNESDTKIWVASDNHPTHSIYSDFDQRSTIPPGETWTFTFDLAGTWGYHNHLDPRFTGQIEVLEQ